LQEFSRREHRNAHAGFFGEMSDVPGDQRINSCCEGSFEKRFVIAVGKVQWVGKRRGMNSSGSNEIQDCLDSSLVQLKFRPFQDLKILCQYVFITYDEQITLKYKAQNPGRFASGF